MSMKWSHPSLGEFTFEEEHWIQSTNLPSFEKFVYDTDKKNIKSYEITFYAETEEDTPTEKASNLLIDLILNQEAIAEKIIEVLWKDLNGIKYDSGMWWHGSFDEAFEEVERAPESLSQLYEHLELQNITVSNATEIDDEEPVAEISFRASFEQEHGVAALSDGKNILGTGYILSASSFKK